MPLLSNSQRHFYCREDGLQKIKLTGYYIMQQLIKVIAISSVLSAMCIYGFAQRDSIFVESDSTLQNVTVTAFSLHSKWKDVPATIAIIDEYRLKRLDEYSLLPAFNSVPGVRMEERSPGSYRLSIRGSLLRSPFGIRNIKIYLDDIPFTDAGGNSYLQLLNTTELKAVEILKGPASSYYGANTGGAVILHPFSRLSKGHEFGGGVSAGSFGLINENFYWKYGSEKFSSMLNQSHRQSDGYREQTAYRNDHLQWNGKLEATDKTSISMTAFSGNLQYETPGGLTLQQMNENPKSARQAAGNFPGAVAQQAGVYNETVFLGVTADQKFAEHSGNKTSLAFSHTSFKNPFITNYEKRNEWNYTARTVFYYQNNKSDVSYNLQAGSEVQFNRSAIDVYGNRGGNPDTVQYKDKLHVGTGFVFAQAQLSFVQKIFFQTGLSINNMQYRLQETTAVPRIDAKIKEGPVYSPRFSLLYKISDKVSVYGIASKGFSPPTLAEIRPSSGFFNYALKAESGWNYEVGMKGSALKNLIYFDVSFYDFELRNAIVRRNDSIGAEYFVNAGSTSQKGIEVFLSGTPISSNTRFVKKINVFNSFSYQPYRFKNYVSKNNDFSGNRLTGVPRFINVTGIDVGIQKDYFLNVNLNVVSSIPLNDANTEYAKPYQLLQCKVGKKIYGSKASWMLFAGCDNMLNQQFSLGNDINAAAGRYYNPAPVINFYAGINVKW